MRFSWKSTCASLLLIGGLDPGMGTAAPQLKYTADSLQKSWDAVYANGQDPLFEDLLQDVLARELLVLQPQDLPAASDRAGFQALPAQAGNALAFFPVRSLAPSQAELLYGHLHKIEGLAGKHKLYIGTVEDRNAPADFAQTLTKRQNGLELERFTATMLMFLTAEKLSQKCVHYSRAKAQAADIVSHAPDELPSGWSGYGSAVTRFIQDGQRGFARIPAHLCQFQTQLGRAENEKTVKAKIHEVLRASMEASIAKHAKVIEQRKSALQSVVSKSEVSIPLDKLSALNRGFRDTNSLLMMIKSDLLQLYTDSPTTKSLIKRLDEKIRNLSQGTDLITVAQKALDDYEQALRPFLVSLEDIPNLSSLTASQKEKVRPCANLSRILSAAQDAGQTAQNQQNFNSCLVATAELYREARENMIEDPALVEFSSKLAMIMSYLPEIPKPNTPRT